MMDIKVLSIGSERNLFIKNSDAQKRIQEYGKLFNELHIIIFAHKNLGFQNIVLANNIFVYPTNHKYKAFYLWNIYKISKLIVSNWKLEIRNSVITVQDPFESGFAGWLLKIVFRIPLQIQIHTDLFSLCFVRESWKNRIRVILAKFLLPKADGIRVVSERIKDSILSRLSLHREVQPPIVVLPIFVDVKKIQSAKIKADLNQKYPEYDFIILMASRLTKEKNIGMAIEAMRKVIEKYPKTLLLIIGDGPEEKELKIKCQMLNVNNNVKFEQWTNDLVSYYKTADLFLLTSNYEGYGRTVIEAMAAGLPVIMTDVGLAGELLVDDLDGQVAPVGDVKALTGAILELIENSLKREEFKQNSLKLLENWPTKQEYLEKYKNSLLVLK